LDWTLDAISFLQTTPRGNSQNGRPRGPLNESSSTYNQRWATALRQNASKELGYRTSEIT
jgi:hypothetical protein